MPGLLQENGRLLDTSIFIFGLGDSVIIEKEKMIIWMTLDNLDKMIICMIYWTNNVVFSQRSLIKRLRIELNVV